MRTSDLGALGGLGPGRLGAPVEHRHAPLREPAQALALPHQLHARRADHDRREGLVGLERRERLHRLAEPLLVGDERAAALRARSARRRAGTGAARRPARGPGARRPRRTRAPPSRTARSCSPSSSSSSSAARAPPRGPAGAPPRTSAISLASAGSPGTATPHERVAVEEAAGAGHRAAPPAARRKSIRRPGSQPEVDGQLRLAVVADLERQLGRARASSPSSSSTRARAREVVELRPLELRDRGAAGRSNGITSAALAPRRRWRAAAPRAARPRSCAARTRPRPREAPTDTSARQRSESLSQASTSGVGSSRGSARARPATCFAEARVGGHAPVLAPPVEPAARAAGGPPRSAPRRTGSRRRSPGPAGCRRAARPVPRCASGSVVVDSDTNLRD